MPRRKIDFTMPGSEITEPQLSKDKLMRAAYNALVRISGHPYYGWDRAMRHITQGAWRSNTNGLAANQTQLAPDEITAVKSLLTDYDVFYQAVHDAALPKNAAAEKVTPTEAYKAEFMAIRSYILAKYPVLVPDLMDQYELPNGIAAAWLSSSPYLIPTFDSKYWTGNRGAYLSIRPEGDNFFIERWQIELPLQGSTVARFTRFYINRYLSFVSLSSGMRTEERSHGFISPASEATFYAVSHIAGGQTMSFAVIKPIRISSDTVDFLGCQTGKDLNGMPFSKPFYCLQISQNLNPVSIMTGFLERDQLPALLKRALGLEGLDAATKALRTANELENALRILSKSTGLAEMPTRSPFETPPPSPPVHGRA